MTCHDARERFSEYLDEALGAAERADIDAHVSGCPECRRELDRLRATVRILSRVERPRAPVGFVDRVMAKAQPAPWYEKLGRRLFLPLGRKLPVEAAAMAMIAVLGVFLLQRTPEMREAGRMEDLRSPASRAEAPAEKPAEKNIERAEPQAPVPAEQKGGKAETGTFAQQAPRAARESENIVRGGMRRDSGEPSPPASAEPRPEMRKESDADRLQRREAPASPPAQAPSAAAPMAPAPASPPAEARLKSREAAEGQSGAPAPSPPAGSAKRQSAMSGVLGRLDVKDRPAAERGLAELLNRTGGREQGRRQELGATVVEVLVPEARYPEFLDGLSRLGSWSVEGQPTAQPTEPPQLRFSIRIAE